MTTSDKPSICRLLDAIKARETLAISYCGGSSPGEQRRIQPRSVFMVVGYPDYYVSAYCHNRGEERVFRVDKISFADPVAIVRAIGESNPSGRKSGDVGAGDPSLPLDQKVFAAVRVKPGQKAKDIAAQLGVDRKLVNSLLHGQLRGKVRQDKSYRWYPNDSAGVAKDGQRDPERLNTPLAKLCRYYLDCLSHDDLGGVSEFATSHYGRPNYVELATVPMVNDAGDDLFGSEAGRWLLGRVRRDRNRQAIYLGYPVRLNFIKSRKSSWEGFTVEPLFLFPFVDGTGPYARPVLSDESPHINLKALRSITNARDAGMMEEAIQLAEELGLGNAAGDQPDLDELLDRLYELRPDWDWKEKPDPYNLTDGTALEAIGHPGIYNRAVIVSADRSPYTRGLESELASLQSVDEPTYRATSLGTWLSGQTIESNSVDQNPLLEVLPLNSEQRQAVRQALANPLTVITGPPGTGKSQVVTSILINAAWQGKTVLFASKNNKAVDVVETRVNALGPRPVLLRLGTNEYQSRLAEYLVSLLAATATADDHERHRIAQDDHARMKQRFEALDSELRDLIRLRNEVDAFEQHAESARAGIGEELFKQSRSVECTRLASVAGHLQAAVDQADKAKQGLLARIVWPLMRGARFDHLEAIAERHRDDVNPLRIPMPNVRASDSSINEWTKYAQSIKTRIAQVEEAQAYLARLDQLNRARPIEDLSQMRRSLTEKLGVASEALWQTWLRLQPARMTPQQRKLLGDYSSLLQMIVAANQNDSKIGRDVFRRYQQLFPQIAQVLSCWAVTSLAARGRIPFEKNFFDLLVIDEASQCDIASVLPLLFRSRHVVVIGDPMQLRHISTLTKQQDQQFLNRHSLLDDFPGWAYSTRSLFDLACSLCRSEDIVALRDHHRSHADIIEFSNEAFYEGRLRVATRYDRLRRPRPDEPAVRWVHVQGRTVRPGSGGAVNEEEARKVVAEIERLLVQGYRGSIGVVSPFRAQATRIRDLAYQHDLIGTRIAESDFLADTVHKFQGDERDVMIFSPAISANVSDGALGFLRSNPNLFNVAITRARAALIVVGDQAAAANCGVDYLERFAAYAQRIGQVRPAVGVDMHADLGPEYPRVSNPERVSDWEKVLYRALFKADIRTIPQYPQEKYALDLAVISGDRHLDIEVDGEMYHRNWDGDLCIRDQIRNQRLMELGWDVMRFWVYQVRDDIDYCVNRVRKWLDA